MSYQNKIFPIGIDRNPLVDSLWEQRFEGIQFPTGGFDFIQSELGDNITTEMGDFLITED